MLPIIVLAGGLATRLRPLTETIPKSLIDINGLPFVIHQLRLFESKGLTRIHFCLGFLGEMVEEIVKAESWKMEITFSYDGERLLGTGGAIKKMLKNFPEAFMITYGDSFLDINYEIVALFYNQHKTEAQKGLMTVFKNDGQWDSSNVIFKDNKIITYTKKYKAEEMKYIDFGLGILTQKHFLDYKPDQVFDLAEIYENASAQEKLIGYEVQNRFYEIGSFSGIQELSNYLKS